VKGKRREAVDKLFVQLYQRGYRLAHWEYNNGDSRCIEVCMMKVDRVHQMMHAGEIHYSHNTFSPLGFHPNDPVDATTKQILQNRKEQIEREQLPLIAFNGYNFHQEMYGFVIYYCVSHNQPIIIYSVPKEKLWYNGWVEFYKAYFNNSANLITWKYIDEFEKDRINYNNHVVVSLTDDDPAFKPSWITPLTFTIDHVAYNRAPQFTHHLAIRPYRTLPIVETHSRDDLISVQDRPYAIPTYPVMSVTEKMQVLKSTSAINVAIIGGTDYALHHLNRLRVVPDADSRNGTTYINVHIVARPFDSIFKADLTHIQSIVQIKLYSDLSTEQLHQILRAAHFVMIDINTGKKLSHLLGYSMTASLPLAFNYLCRLIISSYSNSVYKLTSALEFDIDTTVTDILLNTRSNHTNHVLVEISRERDRLIGNFHQYMKHFPNDV
jgi:hypothetical protein